MGIIALIHRNKFFLILVGFLLVFIYYSSLIIQYEDETIISLINNNLKNSIFLPKLTEKEIEEWKLRRLSMTNLSTLGEILYLNRKIEINPSSKRKFKILVWKYGKSIENRHLKRFSGKKIDPFANCPVKNCDITFNDNEINNADIVIFHLHRLKGINDIPKRTNFQQIWVFLTDESPYHTFLSSKTKLKDFNGLFNWSMSYRSDSDIPVPYGRTLLKNEKIDTNNNTINGILFNKKRDVLVAILGSNCGGQNHRWKYIEELQKFIKIDIYGRCGRKLKTECPGHFGNDCPAINNYLFYLAFENSNCNEYITEKLWWNSFKKNSIPIVMGASLSTYKRLLPINSFIHIDDYASPKDLAQHLLNLNKTDEFLNYFKWKNHFNIFNEHGYFQSKSYHFCRICQAINNNNYNNNKNKKNPNIIYNNLENYWSIKKDCYPAWDLQ